MRNEFYKKTLERFLSALGEAERKAIENGLIAFTFDSLIIIPSKRGNIQEIRQKARSFSCIEVA